jgi:hypothetical protein
MATRPEFPAATYRHMAAAMKGHNPKAEKFYLEQAKRAYENPLGKVRTTRQYKRDAFGNLRFDHQGGPNHGQQYAEHTGVWNPKDATHPGGLSTKKV